MKYKHLDDLTVGEAEADYKLYCGRCQLKKPTVEEQYSFGVYAGRLCRECAIAGYRDACGHLDGQQGSVSDLDPNEPYYEEEV
jgi:hypothetical protein